MEKIWVESGKAFVTFSLQDIEKTAIVKSLARAFFHPYNRSWSVDIGELERLKSIFPNAQVETIASALPKSGNGNGRDLIADVIEIPNLRKPLYPYQKVGAKFLHERAGAILADAPGVGKTAQAIAMLLLNKRARPAVVVVPATLKTNWVREFFMWSGIEEKIAVVGGRKTNTEIIYDIYESDIIIINYDILVNWADKLAELRPQVLIADEAHKLKTMTTKRYKAFKALRNASKKVVFLTGTPILNRPIELFPLLHLVDPDRWHDEFWYAKRYCAAYQKEIRLPKARQKNGKKTMLVWDKSGASNIDELFKITRDIILRRTKKDVLKDLPDKVRIPVALPIDDTEMKKYISVLEETIRAIVDGRSKGETHHALLQVEVLKQECARIKVNGAIEWIEDFLETGEKLVLFATHHAVIESVKEKFPTNSVVLTGNSSQKQRQDAIDRFQNDPSINLFIGNVQAAGVGITLTASSSVAFWEFGWTPGEMEQAEDRVHRIGQNSESVSAWYLVAEGTIDEKIISLLESKRQIVEAVTDGTVSSFAFSTTDIKVDLMNAIANEAKKLE